MCEVVPGIFVSDLPTFLGKGHRSLQSRLVLVHDYLDANIFKYPTEFCRRPGENFSARAAMRASVSDLHK
jgi:hypothetical protein